MGSNGSAGAQAVKATGGLCVAQDPDSAEFRSMPRHLIDAGYADHILRPREMPEILLGYAGHPYAKRRPDGEELLRRERQHFREILAILRTRTRQDFGGYKKPTLVRRIQRRMGLPDATVLVLQGTLFIVILFCENFYGRFKIFNPDLWKRNQ